MPRRTLRPLLHAALMTALAGPATAQGLTFTLVNETGRVILELYASPPSVRAWGVDRLGRDVLPPRASREVRVVGDGSCLLDIQVVFQGGGTEERRGWDACGTPRVVWGSAVTPPVAATPPVATPPSVVTPPPAAAPPAPVPPLAAVRPPAPVPPVAAPAPVPASPAPTPAPATATGKTVLGAAGRQGNPSFNLVNRDGRTIVQFYASPSSQPDWGPDRLGTATVPGGRRHPIRLPLGECVYDLRAVYAGGGSEERRNLDLCDVADVALP